MASTGVDEHKLLEFGPLTISTQRLSPAHERNLETSRHNSSTSTPCSVSAPNGFDTDAEAMMPIRSSDHLNKTTTATIPQPDCTVWPGQEHWRQKARAAKINNRSCQCMARLSNRNRIIVKVLIVALIVGAAVGVGFGISKPLGAGIWQPNNH
ncbi:hypothetical protein GGS23DRAFT_605305 [Durotheca rogersii]|uniref:uncharacterized protein n=1 Tax=Durotheca rogersii TaxID=419775 RepID=UPI00221EB6C6|nr:uncharacterized protein GGS23DRAFT_605305 [Durotheca rogersii]KAI5862734.1 hypothetical protein GGS23DRAFT_605305 [Durotheca rogersii]